MAARTASFRDRYDVVILGGGLAGLSLARQLLLDTDKTVLLLERKEKIPGPRQKVGESQVQLAGYYFSKVLDLEEHLLDRHYMKYNLRFLWPTPGADPAAIESYSQSYIRGLSNIASYQVDRNVLEAEILRRNLEDPRFTLAAPVTDVKVELDGGDAPHALVFRQVGEEKSTSAGWVVDATGRARLLARRMGLARRNRIRHGAFFWWVKGRVSVERLTGRTRRQIRLDPARRHLGHLPQWLATVHFLGDGYWFWVIPLQGKTSLGLVYDPELVPHEEVFSVEKATAWVCRELPLFARDLPQRKVLDCAGFRDYSHDCALTLSPQRWAVTGEAGRFSDPFYSPGSDLIAIYNTLITDTIRAGADEAAARAKLYEPLLRAVYEAYVPGYALGYPVLGDPEIFALKYAWELAVYFAAYVFPFINDLFTERRFLPAFQRFFGRLGPLNRNLQELLSEYHRWKREQGLSWLETGPRQPVYLDFTELGPLAVANRTFFRVGVGIDEAREELRRQLASLEELARFAVAHIAASVAGDVTCVENRRFVESLDPADTRFDPVGWRRLAVDCGDAPDPHPWSFDPRLLQRYRPAAEAPRRAERLPIEEVRA